MELEEESFSTEEARRSVSPSKKKKKKKSKGSEEEPEEQEIMIAEPEIVEESTPTKKKKKTKSKELPVEETAGELEEITPAPSSSKAAAVAKIKLKTKTTQKSIQSEAVPVSAPKPTSQKVLPTGRPGKRYPIIKDPVETEEKIQWDGMNIIAKMPQSDIEELLRRVGLQCPINDQCKYRAREGKIHWGDVSFGCYGPMQCKSVWWFLRNHARKFRIMSEIVDEVKYNFKADYRKFMQKVIESSPDFPKQPYAQGGFQYYCKELWDGYKEIQCKMNAEVGNFLNFQTKCYQDWQQLPEETRNEYIRKAKLVFADHKRKVKEYYAKYPGFAPRVEMLDKDGNVEVALTHAQKKTALKQSNEIYKDAPKLPSTPMQLFVLSKLNRLEPHPTLDELPGLKAHYVQKWTPLSDTKKLKWIRSCIRKSERYLEELKDYRRTHPLYILPKEFKLSRLIKTEEVNLWFQANGQPPKPAINSFDVLVKEFRGDSKNTGKSEEEIRKLALAKWEELGVLHKEMYKLKFKMQQVEFKKDFEAYFNKLPHILRQSAVDRLPKKFRKVFRDDVDKLPLVLENEEPTAVTTSNGQKEIDQEPTSDRKRKHSMSTAEESSQGEGEEVEGEGSSPKKKKKKKRKKNEEDGEEKLDEVAQSSSNPPTPLYLQDFTDEQKKEISKQMREAERAEKKKEKQNVNPDIPDIKVDTRKRKKSEERYLPGKPITQSKKK